MNLDGPIISHDTTSLFFNGKVYRATDGISRCYADNVADLEPYREQGWQIEPLEGPELESFLDDYRMDVWKTLDHDKGWKGLTDEGRAEWYRYWALIPGTIENAAFNSGSDDDRQTAVKVLRAMIDYAQEHGAEDADIENDDIRGILTALEQSLKV